MWTENYDQVEDKSTKLFKKSEIISQHMMQLHSKKPPRNLILQYGKMSVLGKVIILLNTDFVARVPGKSL